MQEIRQRTVQIVVIILGMGCSCFVAAQDTNWSVHPALTDRWTFQLGAFHPKIETSARLNSATGGIGTQLSFESELGMSDTKTTGTFLAGVRLGERWRMEFEYFTLSRDGSRVANRSINWGNQTFAINTVVGSSFDTDIYRLSGGYSFVKDKQKEFGISLGLHATDISASIGAGTVGAQQADVLAPLPTIGIYGAYAFSPKWLLSGRVDYFSLSSGDYDGSLVNFTAGLDYRFTRNFGVGAGWRYVDYDLTVTKTRYNGGITYKFNGPTLYASVSF